MKYQPFQSRPISQIAMWRPLQTGELIQQGDAMRIGDSYELIYPCRYDKKGDVCCVGRAVMEGERIFRKPILK